MDASEESVRHPEIPGPRSCSPSIARLCARGLREVESCEVAVLEPLPADANGGEARGAKGARRHHHLRPGRRVFLAGRQEPPRSLRCSTPRGQGGGLYAKVRPERVLPLLCCRED